MNKLDTENENNCIRYSFQKTVPVLLGYLFLGIAFGLMLQNAGYHFIWAFAISVFVYAGSMQFALVSLLTGGVSLFYSAVLTVFINGRHIFYGLSFIEKYQSMGKVYPYMVFSLTDETYSLLCGLKIPNGIDEKKATFLISFFNHCYWIIGSVIGAAVGQFITFDSTGIDFSMTALFVSIVVDQWREGDTKMPAIIGGVSAFLFLLVLGPDNFLLPSFFFTVLLLLLYKNKLIERQQIK